jgi:hypothetical protein
MRGPVTDAGSAPAGVRGRVEALEEAAAGPPAKEEIILREGSKGKQKQINHYLTRRYSLCQDSIEQDPWVQGP